MGEKASAILSNTKHGSILARVSHAVYLLNERDELCWLAAMDAPMHRRGMKTAVQLPRVTPGSKYHVLDHMLVFNTKEIYDFHQSEIWKAAGISQKEIKPMEELVDSIHHLAGILLSRHHPEGLGCLIEPILDVTSGRQKALAGRFANTVAQKAWPEVVGMIRSLQEKNDDGFMRHAKALVGMGEGLTPSGDDYLGGFLYATAHMAKYYPAVIEVPASNYPDFIFDLKAGTNQISHTILMDQAGGHPPEPLQQLTDSILMGKPANEFISHAERLIVMGHSTGWDILAGWIAGTKVAFMH